MENTLYDYSPIVDRPKLVWPNGKQVAFYIGLNVEHFEIDKPSTSIWEPTSALRPDPLNYGWRDYGVRVGIWRMVEVFDRRGIRPSVLLNSDVAARYPQIIEAGKKRNWVWLAHGKTNSMLHVGMEPSEERRFLEEVTETIAEATGLAKRSFARSSTSSISSTPMARGPAESWRSRYIRSLLARPSAQSI